MDALGHIEDPPDRPEQAVYYRRDEERRPPETPQQQAEVPAQGGCLSCLTFACAAANDGSPPILRQQRQSSTPTSDVWISAGPSIPRVEYQGPTGCRSRSSPPPKYAPRQFSSGADFAERDTLSALSRFSASAQLRVCCDAQLS